MKTLNLKFSFLLLIFVFLNTNLFAVASYSCDGETVLNVYGATTDASMSYSASNDYVGNNNGRYFQFQTDINGTITISQKTTRNQNGYKNHRLKIGTSCGSTNIHNGGGKTSDSDSFSVTSGVTYYVKIQEANNRNYLNVDIDFDFIATLPPPETPPIMGDVPDQTADLNLVFTTLNISNYVTLTDGDAILSYTLTGVLPAGMSFDSNSGDLTGTPTELGTFNFLVTATDDDGESNSDAFSLTVETYSIGFEQDTYTILEDVTIAEGLSKAMPIKIILSKPASFDISVTYSTYDDTAMDGSDYTGVTDTIIISAGETEYELNIDIFHDSDIELDEQFFISLSDLNPTDGSVSYDITPAKIIILEQVDFPTILIGDYRFDACTLGTMVDDSNSGNDGALQNVKSEDIYPKHEEKGMVCRAGRFYSFVANYATAGTNLQADVNGSFSIAFSIEWSGNHGDLPIITKEGDYALKINEGNLYYKLDADAVYTLVPNFSISQNIASHVSFVVTATEVKVYKDAVLTDTIADIYINPNNDNITYIGTDDKTNYFSGLLDEIKFYKGSINQTTITELSGRTLRPCACCASSIKIKGDYVEISNTYDTGQPVWDSVTYDGFRFDEPPLLFMLPSDNGNHSAYIRAKNVTELGFEAANIEPQGEDGPHIAMDLSYIAVSRGVHDLGEHTLEACTIPVQTEQFHDRGFTGDFNATNQTPYGTISCDGNGCWTKITSNSTYIQPVVFATLITAENELRNDQDNASGRELSRPWMTVAIKNDATGIWVSLERSETTYGKITKPELVAYMITEGNIQSSFIDDFDNNVSYETIYIEDRFLGWDKKNDADQRFDFNRTYQINPKPLVMANKQSRKDADGGWFRLNGSPQADYLKVSIWEDRRGSYSSEGSYDNPAVPETPIGVSANQDSERSRNVRDNGAAIVFGGVFQYAESYIPTAGNFDAVEVGANFNTILDTKIVNKPFQLKYWSLDKDEDDITIAKVINSPVQVDFIYSQNPGINLECNATDNLVVPGSTKYTHFLQPNPYIDNVDYNIANSTAYRNVQVRFTFGADENGTAVDWLTCYNRSGDCGDSVYTSECTATCTADVDSARSEACAECYFDNVPLAEIGYSCSFDRFAIRPNAFDIAINGKTADNQELVAGASFEVDANATGYNSTNASQDYNATQTAAGSLSQFHIAPTDLNSGSGCATGLIIDIDDSNFTDGDFNDSDGKYTEIGDINITVHEDQNKIFASVDTGNTNASLDSAESVYTIQSDSIRVTFIPDHFRIAATLTDNSNGFTYLSRDLNVSSTLDIDITAENAANDTTINYNDNCYARATTYGISYNNIPVTPLNHLSNINYIETNTSTRDSATINTNMQLLNVDRSIFPFANGGQASISIDINFDRDINESVNPFVFTITDVNVTDINITDANTTFGSISGLNLTATYLYGRTHASKQVFIVPKDKQYTTNIYYESYCFGAGCDRTLLPDSIASINTNDLRWWVNTRHVQAVDGNITINPVLEQGASNFVSEHSRDMAIDSIVRVDLDYNSFTAGFPYMTTMENNASSWLIENEDNASAVRNEFDVEFHSEGGEWSGEHETNTTTEDANVSRTNRRSMW